MSIGGFSPTHQAISVYCDLCGVSIDLIRFDIKRGEPDHNGYRLLSVRTTMREVVEHVCNGKREQ